MERRKIIAVVGLVFLCTWASFAQVGMGERKPFFNFKKLKNSTFNFGILLQYNQPWYYVVHAESFVRSDSFWAINPKNGVGVSMGITFDWNINKYIQLRTNIAQLVLDYRTVEFRMQYPDFRESPTETKQMETPYLQWPLVVKWQSDVISRFFRVYMFAGAMFSVDIGDKKSKTIRSFSIKNDDWGVLGGVGFHLYFKAITLSPQLQFSAGMTNVADGEFPSKFNQKVQGVYNRSLSFGIVISP